MTNQTDPTALMRRNEWKFTLANWLRDEINETLARYDIPSDVYDKDVKIDSLCVIAAHKAESFFSLDPAAQAALDARDKRIREEALREAAELARCSDFRHDAYDAILALIEKDKTDE